MFISGSALGGMVSRLVASVLGDLVSWRLAMALLGGLGLVASGIFWAKLSASRHFLPRGAGLRVFRSLFATPALCLLLFVEGFLLMGGFVPTFNYLSFRLTSPPFSMSQSMVGAIFVVYLSSEREFLDRLLDHGEIRPALLGVDQHLSERVQQHPALLWKAFNVRGKVS